MDTPANTRLSTAFCSARDTKIPVLVRSPPADDDRSPRELLSCLDYGVRCTGWLCPLFTLPSLPPERLLAEAIEAERARKEKSVEGGKAILKRAIREGRELREQEPRRRRSRADQPSRGTSPS